jgi:hypothetical protein
MRELVVKVESDHLATLARVRKPILAIAELIWNGLDADADLVRVALGTNELGAIERITVSDNGHGLCYQDATDAFGSLGGSWKRLGNRTRVKHRIVHGRLGKGRFRAFSLGTHVTWRTRFLQDDKVLEYTITGTFPNLTTFSVDEPRPSPTPQTGTEVTITGLDKNFPSLLGPHALQEMTEYLALYLREYPDIRVVFQGQLIDPATVEEHVVDYRLPLIELESGEPIHALLTVIEWTTATDRALVLCDENAFALHELPAGIHAPGFNFTAYLKARILRELDDQGALALDELHPDLKRLLDVARNQMRAHFRERSAKRAVALVEEWRKEKIYPFVGEARDSLEQAERYVFDVVALNVNAYHTSFSQADKQQKQLTFRLLREALQSNPATFRRIVQELLDLPEEKKQELADLLEKTSLEAIISAARIVADRLDFLKGLEILVFSSDTKQTLKERSQLHRILAEQTWVFGEEYNLTVDDQSLTEVLRKHLSLLHRPEVITEPVLRDDGTVGIVDLMLSRRVPMPRVDERQHLVVELKRPSVKVDEEVIHQVQTYATAVATDERFRAVEARWTFWAVSNDMTEGGRQMARQRNRPRGLVFESEDGRITVWTKTWGEIINDCRGRLEFFRNNLKYEADAESALAYLRKVHAKYLPEELPNTGQSTELVRRTS